MNLFLLTAIPALAAASAPLSTAADPIDLAMKQAQADAAAAEKRASDLETRAAEARSEAERLRARQLAAAEAIVAEEARITAADAEIRMLASRIAEQQRLLAEQQRPLASLLAGLAMMVQRPPLLAIADSRGSDELVEIQLLVGSTLPVLRNRTVALSSDLERGRHLEQAAYAARGRLTQSRERLSERQRAFVELEAQAVRLATKSGVEALIAGDVAIVAGEVAERLTREGRQARASAQLAAELAELGPAPRRPGRHAEPHSPAFTYTLPATAPVSEGFGAVSSGGIRSRGITLATSPGAPVAATASGIVRFAGPFRSYDGIVIIDHGQGWMTLILNLSPVRRRGETVELGQPLGTALGPIVVELSHEGRRVSPALIAGSSVSLSNRREEG